MTQSVKSLLQKHKDLHSTPENNVKKEAWLYVLVILIQGKLSEVNVWGWLSINSSWTGESWSQWKILFESNNGDIASEEYMRFAFHLYIHVHTHQTCMHTHACACIHTASYLLNIGVSGTSISQRPKRVLCRKQSFCKSKICWLQHFTVCSVRYPFQKVFFSSAKCAIHPVVLIIWPWNTCTGCFQCPCVGPILSSIDSVPRAQSRNLHLISSKRIYTTSKVWGPQMKSCEHRVVNQSPLLSKSLLSATSSLIPF